MSSLHDAVTLEVEFEKSLADIGEVAEVSASQAQDSDLDDIDFLMPKLFTLELDTEDEGHQLSRPQPQRNTVFEESIPRQIIATGVSMQTELQRPIISGTMRNKNAYLLVLQFHLPTTRESQSWSSRLHAVDIVVQFEDASGDAPVHDRCLYENGQEHPSISKTYPGREGWQGTPDTADMTAEVSVGARIGPSLVGVHTKGSKAFSKKVSNSAKVTVRYTKSNTMHLSAYENPISKTGVKNYITIPMIVIHRDRRFQMKVTVKPHFGFWSGAMTETVRTLGRTDDPVYFDPRRMEQLRLTGREDLHGVTIVESGGQLEDVDLAALCILE